MTSGTEQSRSQSLYSLRVRQQPERARLCSYKEENETIDRRPVDPPPVVELYSHAVPIDELLESTSFFIRASIVAAKPIDVPVPDHRSSSTSEPSFPPIKTPIGADATTGEVIQTPEKLRLLDGRIGALCIFAKISVRVPGVFRLLFTLYDTTESGVVELTRTVSEPFEVFSPKLFKGMHESTPLTRHLAAQGLKVKLRTDTTVGRQSVSRRRTPATKAGASSTTPAFDSAHSSSPLVPKSQLIASSSRSSSARPSPLTTQPSFDPRPADSPNPPSLRPTGQSPRSLVWKEGAEEFSIAGPGPSTMGKRRFVDDGSMPSLHDLTSRYDFSRGSFATDLSAFSLSRMDNGLTGSDRGSPAANRNSEESRSPSRVDAHGPPPLRQQSHERPSFRPHTRSDPHGHPHSDGHHRFLHGHSSFPTLYQDQPHERSSQSSMSSGRPFGTSFSGSNTSTPSSFTINSTPASSFSSVLPAPYPRLTIGPGDDGIPVLPLPNMFPSYSRGTDFVAPSVNQVLGGSASPSNSSAPISRSSTGSTVSLSPAPGRIPRAGPSISLTSTTKHTSALTLPPIRQDMQEEAEWAREVARQQQ
ncbi:hypothetical protein IAR55_004946 [Kwoniella newhampshirensis]|uniref:Velvet domain-containing protein n=1 Tax=Kwoniella newhampshirensis TaxID=1651941 RepID=A0AAW0YWI6_9TREE